MHLNCLCRGVRRCLPDFGTDEPEFSVRHSALQRESRIPARFENLSSVSVNPEVTLRDSNAGQFADTFITVGAGTQQRLTAASFGLSAFEGTVVVTSSARLAVIATIAAGNAFETLRASETVLDSKSPGSGATQLIVPFSQGTTGQTRLTIFNPNNTQTTVVIAPVQSDGSLTATFRRRFHHSEQLNRMFLLFFRKRPRYRVIRLTC